MRVFETTEFAPLPSVMLLAVDPDVATSIGDLLKGLQILRVVHPQAALARVSVTQPVAIVVGTRPVSSELEPLLDIAAGVGAEVVLVDPQEDRGTLRVRVAAAVALGQRRRAAPPVLGVRSPSGTGSTGTGESDGLRTRRRDAGAPRRPGGGGHRTHGVFLVVGRRRGLSTDKSSSPGTRQPLGLPAGSANVS
jgi:hypothetical protein